VAAPRCGHTFIEETGPMADEIVDLADRWERGEVADDDMLGEIILFEARPEKDSKLQSRLDLIASKINLTKKQRRPSQSIPSPPPMAAQ
jgi:hypothetical protein